MKQSLGESLLTTFLIISAVSYSKMHLLAIASVSADQFYTPRKFRKTYQEPRPAGTGGGGGRTANKCNDLSRCISCWGISRSPVNNTLIIAYTKKAIFVDSISQMFHSHPPKRKRRNSHIYNTQLKNQILFSH